MRILYWNSESDRFDKILDDLALHFELIEFSEISEVCEFIEEESADAIILNYDDSKKEIDMCEQYYNGKECKIFARRRTVKWKNEINKGNKESRFNSKWSDAEIRAKLTELGFLGEATSTEEKVSTTNEGNTVEQLKTLTKLYESGNLTKEEFDAAKKKVLND